MSDPRVTLDPTRLVNPVRQQVDVGFTDLCRTPSGPRDRQLLYGDMVTAFSVEHCDNRREWIYVQADKDGYCGYVAAEDLSPDPKTATHVVTARQTHSYQKPDFKSKDVEQLSFGSHITCTGETERFYAKDHLHIPKVHLSTADTSFNDPAAVAAVFLGTPYLWGGNTCWGIDCSGLVQAALLACGIPCPGDSDLQMALGTDATGPYQRNDLLFWKGHVALVTDANTLIHANAHAMATVYENIEDAITRIQDQGDGPVTAHRHLPSLSGFINSPPEA